MTQRKPQVGEVSVRRDGTLTGELVAVPPGAASQWLEPVWVLRDPLAGSLFRADGTENAHGNVSDADLMHIHEPATSRDTVAILRMETRQATADINARLDALEQTVARLERIKADDLIAQHGSDGAPEPRPYPGKWSKPGGKVQCVTSEIASYYHVGGVYEINEKGNILGGIVGEELNGSRGTFIPYVEPQSAPPEYPWHDHDGSDKCPVPKRRRGELIAFDKSDPSRAAGDCDTWDWTVAEHWAYTQPDPKPRKWIKVDFPEWYACKDDFKRSGGKLYIRRRVRL